MAKTNVRAVNVRPQVVTHEGGRAAVEKTSLLELRRTLSTCMLFEDTFYESGDSIANRLAVLAGEVTKEELIAETLRAKNDLKLRHAPLWMARHLTRLHRGKAVGDTIFQVIKRADELAEFLALYWKDEKGNIVKTPLSKQAKRGLAMAFGKFDEYQLAKYDRDEAVKLRDVMFLTHPKPTDEALFKRIADRTLATPDTWEVELSSGKDKKETWERLISEGKLGTLALFRNLRNMESVGVDRNLVITALGKAKVDGMLPFQFIAAWKNAPAYSRQIEDAMLRGLATVPHLGGTTALLIDVSGSMDGVLSAKSDMQRLDAAGALAVALSALCDDMRVWTFSQDAVEVPAARGFGLIKAITDSQYHGGTHLENALETISTKIKSIDRLIVITDEQAHDDVQPVKGVNRSYIINVAPYQNGVDLQGKWTRIHGFSTAVIDWLRLEEANPLFAPNNNQ